MDDTVTGKTDRSTFYTRLRELHLRSDRRVERVTTRDAGLDGRKEEGHKDYT